MRWSWLWAIVIATGLVACNALRPDRQSAVDAITELRTEMVEEMKELTEMWAEQQLEVASVSSSIVEAQQAGDEELAAALTETLAGLQESLAGIEGSQDALAESVDDLEATEDKIRAEDAGETVGGILELLAMGLGGGGAASVLLQKFTPSRSAKKIEDVMREVESIRSALEAYQASGGAASSEVADLDAETKKVLAIMAAFKSGMEANGPTS